ncbi:MAG: knotted carbamoyltransferase YgeW [Thermoanaerobaculia bacterium]|nr:knotted carbamoyltransferase YgeW [Thermoanaerobaculia bacterium]
MTINASQHLSRLDASILDSLHGRSMLLTQDWTTAEIDTVCTLAETLQALDREGRVPALFPQQLFWALFFDQSTRTKSSWAGAAARLGGQPVIVDGSSTQVSHGETSVETGAMLGMNSHALGIRHDLILGEGNSFMRDAKKGIDDYLAATGDDRVVPVVNLQCDIDHPTQTLADLLWLREKFPGGLNGKTVTMSWAYSPSYAKPLSVAQGIITLFTRFGMNVRLAHPKGYQLREPCLDAAKANAEASGGSFTVTHDMDAAFEGADIVYPKSWGPYDLMLERVEANRKRDTEAMKSIEKQALERNRLSTSWICDERRMGLTNERKALYMHCLPADIGAEVSPGVMEQFRHDLAREANKKVFAIMALLAAAKGRGLKGTLEAASKHAGGVQ